MTNVFDKSQLDVRSNPNLFINGDFSVDQRHDFQSNSFSTSLEFVADRWGVSPSGATGGTSIVAKPSTSSFRDYNYLDIRWTGANDNVGVFQRVETPNRLSNKTLTFSCEVAANSDFDYGFFIQHIGQANNPLIDVTVGTVTQRVGGWQKIEYTFDIPDLTANRNSDEDNLYFSFVNRTNQTNTMLFRKMKLELGSIATEFIPEPPAVNLANCLRYLRTIRASGGARILGGHAIGGASYRAPIDISGMRQIPRIDGYSIPDWRVYSSASAVDVDSIGNVEGALNYGVLTITAASSLTTTASNFHIRAGSLGYINLSAEFA